MRGRGSKNEDALNTAVLITFLVSSLYAQTSLVTPPLRSSPRSSPGAGDDVAPASGVDDANRRADPVVMRLGLDSWGAVAGVYPCDIISCCPRLELGVRLTRDAIWVGLNTGDHVRLGHLGGEPDWEGVRGELRRLGKLPRGDDVHHAELVASDDVRAETIGQALTVFKAFGLDPIYAFRGLEMVIFFEEEKEPWVVRYIQRRNAPSDTEVILTSDSLVAK